MKDAFPGWQLRLIGSIAIRPYIWRTAILQIWRLVPSLKLRHAFKSRAFKSHKKIKPSSFMTYLRMRAEISHGDPNVPTRARDILEWLQWCRLQLRLRRYC